MEEMTIIMFKRNKEQFIEHKIWKPILNNKHKENKSRSTNKKRKFNKQEKSQKNTVSMLPETLTL